MDSEGVSADFVNPIISFLRLTFQTVAFQPSEVDDRRNLSELLHGLARGIVLEPEHQYLYSLMACELSVTFAKIEMF